MNLPGFKIPGFKTANLKTQSLENFPPPMENSVSDNHQMYKKDSITTIESGISSNVSFLSEVSSVPSNFSENWADETQMEDFLSKVSHEKTFQNIVNQVTADWTDIYMVTSFKGIGSDASRWICVKTGSGRFVYQRRPSRRKVREEHSSFYRSIVLNAEGGILEVV